MKDVKAIWDRYRDGKATAEDLALLESWYLDFEDNSREVMPAEEVSVHLETIARKLPLKKKTMPLWPRLAIASAAAITVILGLWLFMYQAPQDSDELSGLSGSTIRPGKNTATLTLADGRRIDLSEDQKAVTIQASGLSYGDGNAVEGAGKIGAEQLTASTPRGGSYQFILPDGSKVWLNAASTLTFPAAFKASGPRMVELSGEAYFEISKDKKHPFVVKSAHQQIEVLGTHFNIYSYPDESAVMTTLLEGSVKVNVEGAPAITLKPEQQSTVKNGRISVKQVEASYAIAWKNGYFTFNSERLETAMNKIARWYNLSLSYQDASLKDETLLGTISKFDDIGKVLKMIGRTDVVRFEVSGNHIILKRK